jgi:hypothetical protein
MRKQVQKERCTKIMLTKCKAVCCLYNKVQLAAAKMLDFVYSKSLCVCYNGKRDSPTNFIFCNSQGLASQKMFFCKNYIFVLTRYFYFKKD